MYSVNKDSKSIQKDKGTNNSPRRSTKHFLLVLAGIALCTFLMVYLFDYFSFSAPVDTTATPTATPTLSPSEPSSESNQISTEDETAAKEAIMEYYESMVFSKGKVDSITLIDNPAKYEAYIPVNTDGPVIAFEVVISKDYELPRTIVLAKSSDNIWKVVNEGY